MAAGFTGPDLAFASSILASHAIGSATAQVAMNTASGRAGKSPNELVAELDPYLRSLQAEYPSYVAWWQENKSMDVEKLQDNSFRFGLERLLDGLEMWLDREKGRS
jgi:hypothetical protein